jgi:hypothetical protein
MNGINWDQIYWWKAMGMSNNEQLARPIEFRSDFNQNVHETVEWLSRERSTIERFNQEEPVTSPQKEGWFHQEFNPGMFYHVCDGPALLRFRADYENAFGNLVSTETRESPPGEALRFVDQSKKKCVDARIAMWGVIGRDGFKENWLTTDYAVLDTGDYSPIMVENNGVEKFDEQGVGYRWYCHKCSSPMPKALRAWIKISYIRNSGAV